MTGWLTKPPCLLPLLELHLDSRGTLTEEEPRVWDESVPPRQALPSRSRTHRQAPVAHAPGACRPYERGTVRCRRVSDWLEGGGNGSPVDVAALLDHEAWGAVLEMVGLGALVSLGTTSDGGALGITVTVDGRWRRTFVRDSDDLANFVSEAMPSVRAACEARSSSSVPRRRERATRGR